MQCIEEWLVMIKQWIYRNAQIGYRVRDSLSNDFIVQVGLHQNLVLSPLWFITLLEVLSTEIAIFRGVDSDYFRGWLPNENCLALFPVRTICWDSYQEEISDAPQVVFVPMQNLSSGFVEWICAEVITTTQLYANDLTLLSDSREGLKENWRLGKEQWS